AARSGAKPPVARRALQPAAGARVLDDPTCNQPVPDEQYDYRADNGCNQTGALIWAVPSDSLADKGGQESADDAQDRRQDKALRIVGAGRQKARNDAGKKANNDNPKDIHGILRQLRQSMPQSDGGSVTRSGSFAQLRGDTLSCVALGRSGAA